MIYLDEVDSTNLYLKRHCQELPSGTVVYTGRQTQGRGRLNRAWAPLEPGQGLAMSLLLQPEPDRSLSALSLVTGLGVAQALSRLAPAPYQIKWPNDVVLEGKKLCGILCETLWDTGCHVIVGIGVNLRQKKSYFLENGLPYGGSVEQLTGTALSLDTAAVCIADTLLPLYDQFFREGFSGLLEPYRAHCANLGKNVRVIQDGAQWTGTAVDVDESGALVVECNNERKKICSGEASVRGLYGYI